jgi:hypothetical protein
MHAESDVEMHAEGRYPVLVSERLLPEAVPVHSVLLPAEGERLLLPQADAVPAALLHVVLPRRLLPQAVSAILLAGKSADEPLFAVRQQHGRPSETVAAFV